MERLIRPQPVSYNTHVFVVPYSRFLSFFSLHICCQRLATAVKATQIEYPQIRSDQIKQNKPQHFISRPCLTIHWQLLLSCGTWLAHFQAQGLTRSPLGSLSAISHLAPRHSSGPEDPSSLHSQVHSLPSSRARVSQQVCLLTVVPYRPVTSGQVTSLRAESIRRTYSTDTISTRPITMDSYVAIFPF